MRRLATCGARRSSRGFRRGGGRRRAGLLGTVIVAFAVGLAGCSGAPAVGRSHQDRRPPGAIGCRSAGQHQGQRPGARNGRVPAVADLLTRTACPGRPRRPSGSARAARSTRRSRPRCRAATPGCRRWDCSGRCGRTGEPPTATTSGGPGRSVSSSACWPGATARPRCGCRGALAARPLSVRRESLRATRFYGVYFALASAPAGAPRCWSSAARTVACRGRWSRRCWPRTGIRRWPWRTSTRPGLPAQLSDIPLEYFAAALRWLRRPPAGGPRACADLSGRFPGKRGRAAAGRPLPRARQRGHRLGPQRRRDLLLSQLQRAPPGRCTDGRCPSPSSSTTRTRSTTPPRSSRSSGSAARSSSIAAAPTRSGSPARTPGPS